MAKHIYGYGGNSSYENRRVKDLDGNLIGWRLINVWEGRQSMKMGFYIPDSDDWRNPSEYTVVFKGTNPKNWDDLKNDAEAWAGRRSADIWDAMNFSLGFVKSVGNTEVTFVGHSKGGGEAIAAATYTHNNAITFNAANFNFKAYGLMEADRTGTIDNYYVNGEFLHPIIGTADIGNTHPLPTQYWREGTRSGGRGPVKKVKEADIGKNHGIDAVIQALKKKR